MKNYTLDQFRDILKQLDGRSGDRAPHWGRDRDENTLTAEIDGGLVVSLYRRPSGPKSELIGAVLHSEEELEATLEAEEGDEDWALLDRLYESASAAVGEAGGPEVELGKPGPSEQSPHRFDPMRRPEPPPDELTDGDSPLDANNRT